MHKREDSYLTIIEPGQSEFRDSGSRFLGYCFQVNHPDEAKMQIQNLWQQHKKATHICYAYIIGDIGYADDNGEPRHSAGDPILGQLRSFQVDHVLVAVVRYYGGVKLGVSGLINAYRQAAADAISTAVTGEVIETEAIRVAFDYADTGRASKLFHHLDAEITEKVFAEKCYFTIEVRKSKYPVVMSVFREAVFINVLG